MRLGKPLRNISSIPFLLHRYTSAARKPKDRDKPVHNTLQSRAIFAYVKEQLNPSIGTGARDSGQAMRACPFSARQPDYLPFLDAKEGPFKMTMGIQPLKWADWIEIDEWCEFGHFFVSACGNTGLSKRMCRGASGFLKQTNI
eukprot:1148769-Pelagomonas_calceolata.AAC.2